MPDSEGTLARPWSPRGKVAVPATAKEEDDPDVANKFGIS